MQFNENILERYLSLAPIPLAFERVLEARIYQRHPFRRPILDVGCGEGLFAKVVFGEKIDTGIDPNPRELERARALDAYEELIECGGDAIDKPDGYYNTIFSNSVLEHIPDIEPVFREAHRLLADGGKFYLTVPSHRFDEYSIVNQAFCAVGLHGLARKYRSFFNSFWRHYHCYTPEGWTALAQRSGFAVAEIHTYGTKRICLLNDLLAPFCIVSFVIKKLLNRWVLFPRLRGGVMTPVARAGYRLLEGGDAAADGGLVFMELTKA
ncbi:MAG: class I SAM-dependent methyltransferase [Betaproteobacteria bacterium]|nr:class I SAM-dependent methyltransferase [Betaproteobacteria bacterium]